jgi:hypothetical protein
MSAEQTVFIANAVAVAGMPGSMLSMKHAARRPGRRCPGRRLQQANAFKVDTQLGQCFTGDVEQARLLGRREQPADEKFPER